MLRVEHKCEIEAEDEDMFYLPNRNFFRKVFDMFRSLLTASEKNPGTRKYLRSHSILIAEQRRHLRNYKYVLHPFSTFRYFWDILMILTITCLLLAVPYHAAFEMKRLYYWTVCKNLLLSICCMDVIINFMTGYHNKLDQIVVMEPKKIKQRYLIYGTFLPDLLGSLPTDIAFVKTWHESTVTRELVSLICGFRVFSLSSYMTKIVQTYEEAPLTFYEVCVMIFWVIIAFQWQICFYWLIPIATTSMYLPKRPSDDSWINEFNLWEESKALQYLYSLSRAISIFLSSGFVHKKPENEADLTLGILLQFLGSLTIWILIARVNHLYRNINGSKIKYQDITAQLKQYMKHHQLPHSTQDRIVTYYEFCFQHKYFWEAEILKTLSPHMRQEIGMHACRKLVENVAFFSNLPFSLLTRIVALLKSEIFLTNDVIVRANQPGDCMYFIATGTVAIYTASGKEVCHLEDGAHFGEIALVMPDARRVASVIAIEICELYRLNRADFTRTIHPYPMLWEQIKKIAIERHERTAILDMY